MDANMDLNQLQTTLQQLPLSERVVMLDVLQNSVESEYQTLAEQALQEDIYIAEQRLSAYDAGIETSRPWSDVSRRVFGY